MQFYQELSRYYDEIFAVDAADLRFISSLLPPQAAVLDIGCATGNKSILISAQAKQVEAFDLDATMIEQAKKVNSRANIHYSVADMLALEQVFAGRRFDAILCLGNTLVHMPLQEIGKLLQSIAALLTERGVFIVQILNYDWILGENITALPIIDRPNVRFLRNYEWHNQMLHFVTTLEIKQSGQTLDNDIVLYPLVRQELNDLLSQAEFTQIQYYGSYQGDPYHSNSFVTIACCRKN